MKPLKEMLNFDEFIEKFQDDLESMDSPKGKLQNLLSGFFYLPKRIPTQ